MAEDVPAMGGANVSETAAVETDEQELDEVDELGEDELESTPALRAWEGPDVFISYRLDPDQATANALKKLVEGSIVPTPVVFVSGAGGLRPSKIGLKPQLQRAVSAARAFLGVITPQSKDREWVIFEAGAAWGRKQMYAPVLLDIEPHELGTTVADFVATKADHKDEMETLVGEVAKALGASVRRHFSQRYTAFERHLEQRAKKPATEKGQNSDPVGALSNALQLWHKGERDEALRAFTTAEAEASTVEAKAHIQILRLNVLNEDDKDKFRHALLAMPDEVHATAVWLTWKGITERREHVAVADYQRAIAVPTARPTDVDFAVEYCARGLFELGRSEQAVALLMNFIGSVPGERRERFVKALWDELEALSPTAKLALAAAVTSFDDPDTWRRLADTAVEERWAGIGIYAGRRHRSRSDGGGAKNSLGRVYMTAGFVSLAYEAFMEAVEAGASVARANLALCLTGQGVPAAGLALLKQHAGDWDSASPDFPFKMRGEIEQSIAAERMQADQAAKRGHRLLLMLAELVDQGLARGAVEGPLLEVVEDSGTAVSLFPLRPFAGIYEARMGHAFHGLFVKAEDGTEGFSGVRFDPQGNLNPEWSTLARKLVVDCVSNDVPALSTSSPPALPAPAS
jgi:hypothetical protein